LYYFEELKKQQQTGRTVSPLLTEGLLETVMLAKTKHMNLWKFY
jgi:hypothetical protein